MSETRDTRHETRDQRGEVSGDGAGPASLDAWKLSDDLALEIFKISRRLPPDLRWLGSQILRAATSVPANIAEGYSRSSKREFLQFLSVARGSLTEVEYYLHFLRRTELLDESSYRRVAELRRRTGQTLFGLLRSTRARLPSNRLAAQGRIAELVGEYEFEANE